MFDKFRCSGKVSKAALRYSFVAVTQEMRATRMPLGGEGGGSQETDSLLPIMKNQG